jgi:hypothetical protein
MGEATGEREHPETGDLGPERRLAIMGLENFEGCASIKIVARKSGDRRASLCLAIFHRAVSFGESSGVMPGLFVILL